MWKKIIIAVILLIFVFPLLGCEEISDLTQGASTSISQSDLKIERSVELGSSWQMKQIDFKVESGQEVAILLKLAEGGEVDGFFYLKRGETVDFRITGKTQIFRTNTADRFSFAANQNQGDTYNLLFRNTADEDETNKSITVSLEVIYPLKGEIYVPVTD